MKIKQKTNWYRYWNRVKIKLVLIYLPFINIKALGVSFGHHKGGLGRIWNTCKYEENIDEFSILERLGGYMNTHAILIFKNSK